MQVNTFVCETCEKRFASIKKTARFCGQTCRQKARRLKRTEQIACIVCGKEFIQTVLSECCSPKCRADYRREYKKKWQHARPRTIKATTPNRCVGCPSRDTWGRCGAVTSGPMQMIQAVAVRIQGLCPRTNGIRDEIDQWCKRRNNLNLPPLDGHRRIVGKPGSYIEEVKMFE